METTTNLSLKKPGFDDHALVSDLNDNADILDEKIGPVGNVDLQTQISNEVTARQNDDNALNINKKNVQAEVSNPTASGTATEFVSEITQNAQGVITPKRAGLPAASTSVAGLVQLNDTLTSPSTSQALTAAQGKALNDKIGKTVDQLSDLKSALNASAYYGSASNDYRFIGNGFLNAGGLYGGESSNYELYVLDVSECSKVYLKTYFHAIASSSQAKMVFCFYDVYASNIALSDISTKNIVKTGIIKYPISPSNVIEETIYDVPINANSLVFSFSNESELLSAPVCIGYKSVNKALNLNQVFSPTRNLFFKTNTADEAISGVNISVLDDGSLLFDGTSSAIFTIPIMGATTISENNLSPGTYTYHIFNDPEWTASGYSIGMRCNAIQNASINIPPDIPFTVEEETNLFIRITRGKVYSNQKISIELEKGSSTNAYVKSTNKNQTDLQARADAQEALNKVIDNTTVISRINDRVFKPHMKYVSWRGLHLTVPENSIPSYELAGKSCFDVLNIARIRASADKTLWVMHNETVDATTDGTGSVSSLTDEYLSTLHLLYNGAATEYGIPKAEEAIQTCLKYNMIPMLRCYGFSSDTTMQEWINLFALIDGYGIENNFIFSGTVNDMQIMINRYPNGIYIWHDDTESLTNAELIATMNGFTGIEKKNLGVMLRNDATLSDVKAVHKAGYMAYDDYCRRIETESNLKIRLADITAWGYDYANIYLAPPNTLEY